MLKMQKINILFLIALMSFALPSAAQQANSRLIDSLDNPHFVKKMITYKEVYPFVNYHLNYIEWKDYSAIEPFFQKLQKTDHEKLKIVHFGDSHLQVDVYPGYVREVLQRNLGTGGRGMVSPYRAARTHSTYDYVTYASGRWESARNIERTYKFDMGFSGLTIHTTDVNATFKFVFMGGNIRPEFTILKLYCKQGEDVFDIKLKASGVDSLISVNLRNTGLPYVEIRLPAGADTLEFFMDKTNDMQTYFECSGVLIETAEDNGVLYCSSGINGAGYISLIRQGLMEEQLRELQPDLVVIDVGGNDFMPTFIDTVAMEANLKTVLNRIRTAAPDASIIICSMGDSYLRWRHYETTVPFSKLVRRVAFENNCALFDYFNIMGGEYSMLDWYGSGLVQRDRIHYNQKGYMVKGEIFVNAMLNSYYATLVRTKLDNFIVTQDVPDTIKVAQSSPDKDNPIFVEVPTHTPPSQNSYQAQRTTMPDGQSTTYTVQFGDNLGYIAQQYGVKVSDLQYWNSIYGTRIYAGQKLVIYSPGTRVATTSTTQTATTGTQTSTRTNTASVSTTQSTSSSGTSTVSYPRTGVVITHTVKSGDTLWDIARKYNVTVAQIKALSQLTNDSLHVGQVLIISH